MPATRFAAVLERARGLGRAVGAFTCYDLEGFEAVAGSAEAQGAPAIVLISPSSFAAPGGRRLARAFVAMATEASVDLLVQLDHVSDRDQIERAADAGLDAVMADGSKLDYEQNVEFTRTVAGSLRPRGVAVEAELGRVEGHEDRAGPVASGELTDPAQAREFAERTGVDCLAVAVGNVHGHYSGTPRLDFDRLEAITATPPLSLHGASGLPEPALRRAVALGVAKVNVNTELRAAYFGALRANVDATEEGLDLKALGEATVAAVARVVDSKLAAFGWAPEELRRSA